MFPPPPAPCRLVFRNIHSGEVGPERYHLFLLAKAAITKYRRRGDFNEDLFSHCFGCWKSEITVLVWLGSGESSLPGFQMATFSLCPHMRERDRER